MTDPMKTTEPPGDGWQPYFDQTGYRPPDASPQMHLWGGAILELWRAEWGNETSFVNKKTNNPMANAFGLWWRLA